MMQESRPEGGLTKSNRTEHRYDFTYWAGSPDSGAVWFVCDNDRRVAAMKYLELGSLNILLCSVSQLVNNERRIVQCGSSGELLHPSAA